MSDEGIGFCLLLIASDSVIVSSEERSESNLSTTLFGFFGDAH